MKNPTVVKTNSNNAAGGKFNQLNILRFTSGRKGKNYDVGTDI